MVLLECENNLAGIFVMVIAIVFEHAPAENCRRSTVWRIHTRIKRRTDKKWLIGPVIKSIGIRNSNKHRRPKNVQVFSFSPINRRSIRKGIRINTGLRDKMRRVSQRHTILHVPGFPGSEAHEVTHLVKKGSVPVAPTGSGSTDTHNLVTVQLCVVRGSTDRTVHKNRRRHTFNF